MFQSCLFVLKLIKLIKNVLTFVKKKKKRENTLIEKKMHKKYIIYFNVVYNVQLIRIEMCQQ